MPQLPNKKERREVQKEQNKFQGFETPKNDNDLEPKAIDLAISISDDPEEKVVQDDNDPALYDREYKRQGRMPKPGRKEPV